MSSLRVLPLVAMSAMCTPGNHAESRVVVRAEPCLNAICARPLPGRRRSREGERMKKLWRRLNRPYLTANSGTSGTGTEVDRAKLRQRRPRPTITSQEAARRFRAHALEEKGHDDVLRIGLKDSFWSDVYHHALTAGWPQFLFSSLCGYLAANLIFAAFYELAVSQISSPRPLSLLDLFFFSVQTLSTVGYGVMAPVGPVANAIVSVEVLVGMMVNALATGLVFARFARPRARLMFGRNAVISDENKVSALCVRVANQRRSMILSVDAEIALSLLRQTADGHLVREFHPLQLVQAHVPVLRFAFVIAHVIDADSPLTRHSLAALAEDEAEIIVTVTGTDEATGQSVFARTAYRVDQILINHRFVDMVRSNPTGRIAVDFSRFHDTEAHAPAPE
ncbi:ion channel [Acetobacter sp. DsW_063]|uniref:ion channel n=1 Tax=Acetobacter sp. DsW_063 TaxID=1514894 RepID=UPI001E42C297|nr:ion channel [Acetobacter sp. DsW_063]